MGTQFENYPDFEIIQRIIEGDLALFEILIRRYNLFLYKIGRTYRYNHANTEDLMQDTYIYAYVHLQQFETGKSFETWLTKIMLNQCYQKRHKLSFKDEIITHDIQNEKPGIVFINQPAMKKLL